MIKIVPVRKGAIPRRERIGDKATQVRGMVDAPGGWTAILESFKKSAPA